MVRQFLSPVQSQASQSKSKAWGLLTGVPLSCAADSNCIPALDGN